jgi:sarcosine oxidase subunit beta
MLPDVVIIGGGVIGCSCAYYLSRERLRVHLLEKADLGSGTSKAGQCHICLWEKPEIILELCRASKQLYQALNQEAPFDFEYKKTGSIAVVERPEGMASFAETVRWLQAWGLNCQLLDARELVELEPNLAPDIGGGAFFPEDSQVNPMLATLALARGAKDRGAVIQPFTEVTGIELAGNKRKVTAVQTSAGRIPTSCVVNAAGPWSAAVGEMAGLRIPVTPRKGHLVVTEPVPEDITNCRIVLSAGYMDSLTAGAEVAVAANLQHTRSASLVLGSSRQFVGFDRTVDPTVISLMVARCVRLFPILAGVHAIRSWAGLRPYTPDLLPIIGPVDQIEGFHVATGHEGLGITMGPITGRLIAQLIRGQEPDVPVGELSLSRFADTSG